MSTTASFAISDLENEPVADDEERKLTTWTLGAIKARNMALEGYCETQGCHGFYVFNIDGLIVGFGEQWLVPETLPIPCSECGGRLKFKLAIMPPD
jgi:hypothetical protein